MKNVVKTVRKVKELISELYDAYSSAHNKFMGVNKKVDADFVESNQGYFFGRSELLKNIEDLTINLEFLDDKFVDKIVTQAKIVDIYEVNVPKDKTEGSTEKDNKSTKNVKRLSDRFILDFDNDIL